MNNKYLALVCAFIATPLLANTQVSNINVGDKITPLTEADVKMYPQASDEKTRHVIALSPLSNENDAKIELRFKKTIPSDCNTRGWFGVVTENVVDGWGYQFYDVEASKNGPMTKMACEEAPSPKEQYLVGEYLIDYNSKLPIVVYTDKDTDVEVRVWQPTATY